MNEEKTIQESLECPEIQFREWIKSLDSIDRRWAINRIALACDMSYQGVYKWSIGKGKIKRPFLEKINQVAGKEVIKI